jgi:hypothetical protein
MKTTLLFAMLLIAISCASAHADVLEVEDADDDKVLTNVFTLEFDYAAQKGIKPQLSKFSIFFNGDKYHTVTPKDYNVHHNILTLVAQSRTQNVFTIKARGKGFRTGVTVANFQLKRKGKCSVEDIFVNGFFTNPSKLNGDSKKFSSL